MVAGSRSNSIAGSASAPQLGGPAGQVNERPVDAKPLFRLDHGSASAFLAMRPEGAPPRKTWDRDNAFAKTNNDLFRLKVVNLPDINERAPSRYCKAQTSYNQKELFAHAAAQLQHTREISVAAGAEETGSCLSDVSSSRQQSPPDRFGDFDPTQRIQTPAGPQRRADKYFDVLMKQHYKRVDGWKDEEEQAAQAKAEFTAAFATRKRERAQRRKAAALRAETKSRSSDEESEEASEEEAADQFLQPLDGKMKIDLEICVLRAPDASEASQAETSVPPSSSRSSKPNGSTEDSDGERLDLANELDALKEEMQVDDRPEEEADSEDDLPEHLRLKKFGDISDNPNPRWALGIGGTVFFVPDAERYAFGPSLPPPPPPSLFGRKRTKMKPRLPLDISNHRYRDEHPNIWPTPPYVPGREEHMRFERTLLTLDLYKSCSKAMTQLPQATRAKDLEKHKTKFGKIIEAETKRSVAWKNYNLRQKLLRKEAERVAQEKIKAAEAAARAAAIAAAAEDDEGLY